MPVIHTRIAQMDVLQLLRQKGYAFISQRGCALRLTQADKSAKPFQMTGRMPQRRLIPLTDKMLDDILTLSRDAKEAAEQIEAISLGHQTQPQFGGQSSEPSLTPEMVNKLVRNQLDGIRDEYEVEIANLKRQLSDAQEAAAPKKRGRPKGSKNKPKSASVLKAQQAVETADMQVQPPEAPEAE